MKITQFFKRYPLILVFIILIVVVNIWALAKSAGKDKTPSAAVTATSQAQQASDAAASDVAGGQTTAPAENAAAITTTTTTTEPASSFQTVDAAYFDDALFIGDSRTEGLALYGSLTNADYFTSIGISIFQVAEKTAGNPNTGEECTLASKLSQKHYGKIYIMLGINELGTGTAESWAQKYSEVITQVRQAQPDAIIYLQSIMLVSAAKDDPNDYINNNNIRTRNEALKALENPQDNIFYLDVNEVVADANGCLEASYTSDGIHLLGNSLTIWEDYLKQHAVVTGDMAASTTAASATTVPVVDNSSSAAY